MGKAISREKQAPYFLFLAAFLWSLSGIITKSVVFKGIEIAILRGLTACVLLVMVTRRIPKKPTKATVLGAVCFLAQGLLFICANKYTTAGNATVLQNTSPIYILLFTSLANKSLPRRRDIITCIVLLAGIFMAFIGNLGGGGTLGNIMALVAALFYAGVYFCSRMTAADAVDSVILGNALYILLVPFLLSSETIRIASWTDWGATLLFGVCSGGLAWLCFAMGIKYIPPLKANFITITEPIMAPIWTFLLLHEKLSQFSLLGCAIVIVTLLIYHSLGAKEQSQKTAT